MPNKPNLIQQKTFQFSLKLLKYARYLRQKHEYDIARQLVRCGTSVGANVEEAIGAQSRKDFISKLSIARKEARETNYWLLLLQHYDIVNEDLLLLVSEIDKIIAILTAIIKTISNKNP